VKGGGKGNGMEGVWSCPLTSRSIIFYTARLTVQGETVLTNCLPRVTAAA
jgi:hypothetical protein